jgi:hypothetical protein
MGIDRLLSQKFMEETIMKLRKIMACVLAVAMIAGLAIPASATLSIVREGDTWTITNTTSALTNTKVERVIFTGRLTTEVAIGEDGIIYFRDVGVGSLVRLTGIDRWGLATPQFAQGYVHSFRLGGQFGQTILRDGVARNSTKAPNAGGNPVAYDAANFEGFWGPGEHSFANAPGATPAVNPGTANATATARQNDYNTRVNLFDPRGLNGDLPVVIRQGGELSGGTGPTFTTVDKGEGTYAVENQAHWRVGGVLFQSASSVNEVSVRFGTINLPVEIEVWVDHGNNTDGTTVDGSLARQWATLRGAFDDPTNEVMGIVLYSDVLLNEGFPVTGITSTAQNDGRYHQRGGISLENWREVSVPNPRPETHADILINLRGGTIYTGRTVPFTSSEMSYIAQEVGAGGILRATATVRSTHWRAVETNVVIRRMHGNNVNLPKLVTAGQTISFDILAEDLVDNNFQWNLGNIDVTERRPITQAEVDAGYVVSGSKAIMPADPTREQWENANHWDNFTLGIIKWEFELIPADEVVDPNLLMGDVNGDGVINMVDALAVLRYAAGASAEAAGITNMAAADVNGDGQVTSADALLILMMAMGLGNA